MSAISVRVLTTLVLVSGLLGCKAEHNSSVTSAPEPSQTASQAKPLTPCGSGAPRVDRDKIYDRLKAEGVITDEMSTEQADKIVSDYIQQRQQAYKRCVKGAKP